MHAIVSLQGRRIVRPERDFVQHMGARSKHMQCWKSDERRATAHTQVDGFHIRLHYTSCTLPAFAARMASSPPGYVRHSKSGLTGRETLPFMSFVDRECQEGALLLQRLGAAGRHWSARRLLGRRATDSAAPFPLSFPHPPSL